MAYCREFIGGTIYLHRRGAFSVLVSADRAMREPRYVERAADWLHVFLYVLQNEFGQFGAIDGSVIS